jgi:hypothetical protein
MARQARDSQYETLSHGRDLVGKLKFRDAVARALDSRNQSGHAKARAMFARPTRTATFLAVSLAALVIIGSALGAIPAWQWTPAQASRNLVAWNPRIHFEIDQGYGNPDLVKASCRGWGNSVRGRYTTFRCMATFLSDSPRQTTDRKPLWLAVRKVRKGQPCVTLGKLFEIPVGCLDKSGKPRVPGSLDAAIRATRRKMHATYRPNCWGYGAGFYQCQWQVGANTGLISMTFTSAGVVFIAP